MLDEPPVRVQDEDRADEREDESGRPRPQQAGEKAADEGAGETEADGREDPHRIGAGQRKARERAHDEAPQREEENQGEHDWSLAPKPLDQTRARRVVLVVVEDARVVELVEHADEVRRVLLRILGLRRRRRGRSADERLGGADPVGIDAGALQALPIGVHADATLREAVGVASDGGAPLHEAAVRDDERDGDGEADEADDERVARAGGVGDAAAAEGAGETDEHREPHRHRVRSGNGEARERAGHESGDEHADDRPGGDCAEDHAGASTARSSRRRSLISSRSLAAYSNRSSSAARYISSSSVTTSFSSSSRDMPSTFVAPLRRRDDGTVGDSSWSSSAMSETPFAIVSGTIPCSSLYASCTARRRFVSP